ncbi:MAG: hypothetical protein WCT42_02755 [Candidatus Paceibacterota bacterium]|jgi:hypothetical protein
MENFNHKEYRDNLAKDLKEIRKTDPEKAIVTLAEEKETEEYIKALSKHKEDKTLENINIDNLLKEASISKIEVPSDAKDINDLQNGDKNLIQFIVNKYKKLYPTSFYELHEKNILLEKIDLKIFSLIEKELLDSEQKAPKGWLNLGTSKPKHFMDILNNLAEKQPDEYKMFKIFQENDLRNPYGTKVGEYLKYYSPKIINETKEIIEAKKHIKNKGDWYTKYSAIAELGISLERMNAYIIEYEKKEPDYIVENELEKRTYIYKELVLEIKERIKNGEKEKIIPKDWLTLQEITDDNLFNIKIHNPVDVVQYLLKEDNEIKKILSLDINHFDKIQQNSKTIIKRGNELYFSPSFVELLKRKITELEQVKIPYEADDVYFLNQHWLEFAKIYNIDELKAIKIYKSLKEEYKNKQITKIEDGKLLTFYPSEFKKELEKRLLGLK